MKKLAIIGASGMAGSAIYKLTIQNPKFEVTGIVRNEDKAKKVLGNDAKLLLGNVLTMPEDKVANFDIIVDAFGTTPEKAADQITLAKKLIAVARKSAARVILILGAGSLHTGNDQHLFVEDIDKIPGSDAWSNTPKQQLKELQYLESVDDVDWLGISPSADFKAGPATDYILGKDELLKNEKGKSETNSSTMAEIVVNEAAKPVHHKQRITVANK